MQNIFDFNYDWEFFDSERKDIRSCEFCERGESVTIPHTPRMESLDVTEPFQGTMFYRKLFKIPSFLASKNLFIDFEGVMTKCIVYINGKRIAKHFGGYLPFSIDITRYVKMNANNLIVVEVDNHDDTNVPPGKPTSEVDFIYFGGIYRNVHLRATDKVYIDKPVTRKGAGVFAYTERVTDNIAHLGINVQVNNAYFKKQRVYVKQLLFDSDGYKVTEVESKPIVLGDGLSSTFTTKMVVTDPMLWDTEHPYLYTLRSEVYANDELADLVDTTIGIRTVEVNSEGFFLNGKLVRLNGANRHQQFPYIGIAGSDNADYRDMYKLKEAGFNIVRLSHYPMSDALMDACDRLGLMVIVCTPGWQFCKAGVFKRRVIENLKDMVRKDRNHPSAVIWEASLNETGFWWLGATDAFFRKCVKTVRNEFAPHKVLVCGDTIGRRNWKKIGYDIPFTGWDNKDKIRVLDSDIKGITREYGDYEFGGHNSTTRVRIGEGEMPMRIQALNFQWSHNMNIGSPYELGDLIWEGFDHNRGMGQNKPTSTSGIFNEWRLPKFSYYFFKSQRDDEDMVFLPTFWNQDNGDKLTLYSNADEVELLINGQKIARKAPNDGETKLFDSKFFEADASVDYWLKGGNYDTNSKTFDLTKFVLTTMDDGCNCKNLHHAPFTFDGINYQDGCIEARAYKNGRLVASHKVYTPREFASIRLEVDYSGKKLVADGRDKVFVRAYILDENCETVKNEVGKVVFTAQGGTILGCDKADIEAGVASALLMADKDAIDVEFSAKYKGISSSLAVDIVPRQGEEI